IEWPDGKLQLLLNVKPVPLLTINYKDAKESLLKEIKQQPLFVSAAKQTGLNFKSTERDFIDYNIQPTLPHKLSQYGPGIAVGDIDNNGFEDFYLSGSSGNPGKFFMQDAKGVFTLDSTRIPRNGEELNEEMGVLFFDADNDGDLDLYAVGGSYEVPPNNPVDQDRLFINNGKGKFTLAKDALPAEVVNGSCVRAADFDKDGDLDLFIGGRVVSGSYPTAAPSFILQNNGGQFTDVTEKYCPSLKDMGMITDALWTDFDGDGKVDLLLTGEWMPITFLKNTGTGFIKVNETTGIADHLGWWNSLVSGDFDNDGDIDYIAGNLGLNSNYKATVNEPMTLLAKDLDLNGSLDVMLFCYMKAEDGTQKPFPMHTKDDLISQLVSIRRKYPTYRDYGMATMDDIWKPEDRKDAIVFTANDMQTSFIENKGGGRFEIRPLPLMAQTAPVFGMIAEDINNDGNLDLMLNGNDFGMEPYSGRHDAFNGLCLLGDGKGGFKTLTVAESGFFVNGDGKGLARIHSAKNEDLWIATQNQDSLVVVSKRNPDPKSKWVTLKADDASAILTFRDGRKRKIEFYYGSTFLSQSSRKIPVDKDLQRMTITNFKGIKREAL
ncbi:MAG: VCBS repeat-containing protein, partial [Chitinophagaceae bacterium]